MNGDSIATFGRFRLALALGAKDETFCRPSIADSSAAFVNRAILNCCVCMKVSSHFLDARIDFY